MKNPNVESNSTIRPSDNWTSMKMTSSSVEEKEKKATRWRKKFFCFLFKSEEPVKMIGLVELLKSMNFADDDDDELDLRILDDHHQTTNKRFDQITKIPDRLIFLIVRFFFFVFR